MKIVKPSATLLYLTKDAEKLIERAGRVCYKSECKITEESSGDFIRRIIDSNHYSVIEHASATFLFVTDRGVSHEMVRHRIASFSQESTRYCNYSKGRWGGELQFILPPLGNDTSVDLVKKRLTEIESTYKSLIEHYGKTPQIARAILPNCLKTEIVVTANLREWRHIFQLRLSKAAHPQIRQVMSIAAEILLRKCPNVFYDMKNLISEAFQECREVEL